MNYLKLYQELCTSRKELGKERLLQPKHLFENHHIKSRCLEGSNEKENLVLLLHREHFMAHYFLYRAAITGQLTCTLKEKRDILFSFLSMKGHPHINKYKRYFNSRLYGKAKVEWKLLPVPEETRKKLSKAGKKRFEDPEERRKVSETSKKQFEDPEERRKMSEVTREWWKKNPEARKKQGEINRGKTFPEEHKKNICIAQKEAWKRRKKLSKLRKRPLVTKETKEKISEALKGRVFTEEEKQKNSEAQIKRWKDPEQRRKQSEAAKAAWKRRKEKNKLER